MGKDSSLNLASVGTISLWVKTDRDYPCDPDTTSTCYRGIISKASSGNSGLQSYYIDWHGSYPNRILRAVIRSGTGSGESYGINVSNFSFDNSWQHITITWDGVFLVC